MAFAGSAATFWIVGVAGFAVGGAGFRVAAGGTAVGLGAMSVAVFALTGVVVGLISPSGEFWTTIDVGDGTTLSGATLPESAAGSVIGLQAIANSRNNRIVNVRMVRTRTGY